MRRFSYVLEWAGVVLIVSTLIVRAPLLLGFFREAPNVFEISRYVMSAFIIVFGSVQVSLVLHNETLGAALQAHKEFIRTNLFRFGWFLLIAGLHYFILTTVDVIVRSAVADRVVGVIAWKIITLASRIHPGCAALVVVCSANVRSAASARKPGFNPRLNIRLRRVNAAKITRDSKSNLALAFVALGKERREDITVFYAFCRMVDDIADSPGTAPEEKARELAAWRKWLHKARRTNPVSLATCEGVRQIRLTPRCWRKSSRHGYGFTTTPLRHVRRCGAIARGQRSLCEHRIFGYRNPLRDYAIQLAMPANDQHSTRCRQRLEAGRSIAGGSLACSDIPRPTALRKHNDVFVRLRI